jgi:hypothetical protein
MPTRARYKIFCEPMSFIVGQVLRAVQGRQTRSVVRSRSKGRTQAGCAKNCVRAHPTTRNRRDDDDSASRAAASYCKKAQWRSDLWSVASTVLRPFPLLSTPPLTICPVPSFFWSVNASKVALVRTARQAGAAAGSGNRLRPQYVRLRNRRLLVCWSDSTVDLTVQMSAPRALVCSGTSLRNVR